MTQTIILPACPSCARKMTLNRSGRSAVCFCGVRKRVKKWASEQGRVLNVVIVKSGPDKLYPRQMPRYGLTDAQYRKVLAMGADLLRSMLDKV